MFQVVVDFAHKVEGRNGLIFGGECFNRKKYSISVLEDENGNTLRVMESIAKVVDHEAYLKYIMFSTSDISEPEMLIGKTLTEVSVS